jgi:very-short-patch-repair endonuclease
MKSSKTSRLNRSYHCDPTHCHPPHRRIQIVRRLVSSCQLRLACASGRAREVIPRAPLLKRSAASKLEGRFDLIWRSINGPELEREFRFHAERKWRADFAHLPSRTLIEIEGGVFGYGRHNRPMGFIADAEKHLAAFQDGWTVLRIVALHITTPILAMIAERLGQRASGHV